MKSVSTSEIRAFVNNNIASFHKAKFRSLAEIKLTQLLKKKNPYLFKAKNLNLASDLVITLLDAHLSSSEEKLFGDFLEELAIFVAAKSYGGRKSGAQGIDLEFERNNALHIVSIKSGPNWGNSSQQSKQQADFQRAIRVIRQSNHALDVRAVLGICYGKTKTSYLRGYLKLVGQNFWYYISGNAELYKNIIEPLGYRAKERNERFMEERAKIINLSTQELLDGFASTDGQIDWEKLVEFNSGNLDIEV